MKLFKQIIFLLYFIPSWVFASVWYIDDDISNSGDGTSWADAFKTIQEGVDAATDNDEIWLKLGTYSLSSTITIKNAVAIYGGFSGLETDINQRDWYSNTTTVSGNNSVRIFHISADVTIDGLTMTNGTAINNGGAIYNFNASPNITNCKLINNNVSNGGGAIYNNKSNPTISNCSLINNQASNGGGIYNQASSPIITNCSFDNNNGGIYNDSQSSPNITNTIIWNSGTSITNETGATPVISYSNIQNGGYTEDGNMDNDPLFNSDLQLQVGSPVINQANNVPSTDIDGNPRLKDEGDIGAYEYYESGVLRFSKLDTNSFNESYNSPITIEVQRLGGSSGEISVDYASKSGSAGNKDYTPVSGTLTWGDGDNSSKTFTVQINEDNISESSESFSFILQNATGGAVAASSPILLQITDNSMQAKFTMTYQDEAAAPLTVDFDASQSIAQDNSIVDYEWIVNNGTSFFGNPTSYTFKEHGTYEVKLVIKSNNNATSEITKTLKVKARPIAQIEVDPPKEIWSSFPQQVQLDGTKSNDPDGSIEAYEWLVNGKSISGKKANAIINNIDDLINLKITDNDGFTASVNYTTLPIACIQDVTPKKGEPGLKVSLDASCSTDDDGNIMKYDWYANGQTVSSETPDANITFKKSGSYKISLVVTDNDGAKSSNNTKEIEVFVGKIYTVKINKEGNGSGIITDKPLENDKELPKDMDINCGDDCSESYIETRAVSLFGKADVGSIFKGWEAADCDGTGSCRFKITQDEIVTAKFDLCKYTIEPTNYNNPHSYEEKGYSLKVTTSKGCKWSAENDENNKWVDIRTTPKHSTGGIVNYWIEDNPNEKAREAVLTIAGKKVTVTQIGHYKVKEFNVSSSKGNAPLTIIVTANNTKDPVGSSLSDSNYKWETSDGQSYTGEKAKIKFEDCSDKPYTITLIIENNGEVYGSVSRDIEVNCLPTAKFSYRIMFGSYLKVDASDSMDEDGYIREYQWFVGNSSKTSGKNANIYLQEGTHNIKLEVTDNRGKTHIVSQQIEIVKPYNDTARVSPQVIAAGISPSQINLNTDDRYDVVAIVRPGVNPINTVLFQDADMSNIDNITRFGIKMSRAGILPNGDEVYKVSYAYDRNIGNTTISTTWGSKPGQFNIEAIDNLQQYSHIYPYLIVGNYPSQTVNKQSASSIRYDNTRRNDPQVIMAGYSPAKLDFSDTEFDVIAIVRQGKLPIKRVIAKSNATGVFHKIMHYIGELDNGDQVYKITITYPRGALGAGTTISYKDLFGPAETQFGIEAVDKNEQGSHQFPDIKFGNYPEYHVNPFTGK